MHVSLLLPHNSNVESEQLVGGARKCQRIAVVLLHICRARNHVAQFCQRMFPAHRPCARVHQRLRSDALGAAIHPRHDYQAGLDVVVRLSTIGVGDVVEIPIDIVVSGINPNANIGHDVTYSGTVTAAMEAVIDGVKGIAVSLNSPQGFKGQLDYSTAAIVARRVTEKVIADGLPDGVVLNVNVPYLKENEFKGYMITRQGLRVYRDALDERIDPRGRPYYWIGGEAPTGVDEPGTDFGALTAGYVSITPLQLDLTNYKAMDVLKKWKFK